MELGSALANSEMQQQAQMQQGSGTAAKIGTKENTQTVLSSNFTFPEGTPYGDSVESEIPNQGESNLAPLHEFFTRPKKVKTLVIGSSWPPVNFDPVLDYFSDSVVKAKIRNFSYIRFKLHLRLVINASQFLYGKYLVVWKPLNANFSEIALVGASDIELARHYSTYPIKGYFHPGQRDAVELEVPFMWKTPYFNISQLYDGTLGTFQVIPINPLTKASTTAPNSFEVSVFAWFTDVDLNVPTSEELYPTGYTDETDSSNAKGFISSKASAIAGLATGFSKLPIIGSYAKAVEIGAKAVGGVAKLFGFSAPVNITTPTLLVKKLCGNFATTIGLVTATPLSLDPKCELTIDSSSFGWTGEDEMLFEYIARREMFLTSALWSSTGGQFLAPYTDVIAAVKVNPQQYAVTTYTKYNPIGYAMLTFDYWKATIVFRIEVVASNYHNGSLLIQYEPNVNQQLVPSMETNVVQTYVLDISETRTHEIRIEYVSNTPFKRVRDFAISDASSFTPMSSSDSTYTIVSDPTYDLGMLVISQLNTLTAPDSTVPAYVNVYQHVEDVILAQPNDSFQTIALDWAVPTSHTTFLESSQSDTEMLSYFGETIPSIRTLMKRDCATAVYKTDNNGFLYYRCPLYGFNKRSASYSINGFDTKSYNTYQNFFALMYKVQRGSMRHKTILDTKRTGIFGTARTDDITVTLPVTSPDTGIIPGYMIGGLGIDISDTATRKCVDVQIPYYNNAKFDEIYGASTIDDNNSDSTIGSVTVFTNKDTGSINAYQYLSTGEDYMAACLLAAPLLSVPI